VRKFTSVALRLNWTLKGYEFTLRSGATDSIKATDETEIFCFDFQWSRVKCRKFDRLEREMNPASNFACYRSMFKMANEGTGGRVGKFLLKLKSTLTVYLRNVALFTSRDPIVLSMLLLGWSGAIFFCLEVIGAHCPKPGKTLVRAHCCGSRAPREHFLGPCMLFCAT